MIKQNELPTKQSIRKIKQFVFRTKITPKIHPVGTLALIKMWHSLPISISHNDIS